MGALQTNCPSCGAPLQFQAGDALVVVCASCRSAVARTDRGVEDVGKVAELHETESPLSLGVSGQFKGVSFHLVGRTQIRHQAGGVWDEWYAFFDDGRWGWLAEAQGRFFLLFETMAAGELPQPDKLQLGERCPGVPNYYVTEVGEARYLAAEGEIPFRFVPDQTYFYADLSGPKKRFGTLDFSQSPPAVYLGQEYTLAELNITALPKLSQRKVQTKSLQCANCAGPLELHAPDISERIVCPYCGSLHDCSHGELKYLSLLKPDPLERKPTLPFGKKAEFEGVEFTLIGFMVRSCRVEGVRYPWEEYLLYHPSNGFRWLVRTENHWLYVNAANPGDVQATGAQRVQFDGKTFTLFQRITATVDQVSGEFYWKVQAGEKAKIDEFINPPHTLSREVAVMSGGKGEVNWSIGWLVPPEEIEKKFGVTLPRPQTVSPWDESAPLSLGAMGGTSMVGCLFGAGMLIVAAIMLFSFIGFFSGSSTPNYELVRRQTTTGAISPRTTPVQPGFQNGYLDEKRVFRPGDPPRSSSSSGRSSGSWGGGGGFGGGK